MMLNKHRKTYCKFIDLDDTEDYIWSELDDIYINVISSTQKLL